MHIMHAMCIYILHPQPTVRNVYIIRVHACIHACLHTHIHVQYMHTCIHTYICNAYIHTCLNTCTYLHNYVYTCIHSYVPACIHTYIHTCIHTYTYIHACIHTYMYRPTQLNKCIRTYLHTFIHIHTYIHSYIVLYCIYTVIQRFMQCTPIRSASSARDPERREYIPCNIYIHESLKASSGLLRSLISPTL